ncbi:MAG TPA: TldD/PmbA family protein [bacterium]|nr:TldD/PmbA family protein [bacterium]
MNIYRVVKKIAKPAETYLIQARASTIELSGEKIESIEHASTEGLGLRIIDRGGLGFSYTSNLSTKEIKRVVEEASLNARYATRDRYNLLPQRAFSYPRVNIYDEDLRKVSLKEKIGEAKKASRAALEYDKRIRKIYKTVYHDTTYKIRIFNSEGLKVSYSGTSCSISLMVIAKSAGESQSGSEFDIQRFYEKLKVEKVGRRAAQKALSLLGAKKIKTQRIPILLDSLVGSSFLGLIASALSAEAVQRKRSLFRNKLDKRISAQELNIIDDGTLEEGLGSAPCDDEGVPTSRKILIEKGMLRGYLYNTYAAAKEKKESTGNGMRGSFKSLPGIGATNLFISPGRRSRGELIKGVGRGLYVTETLGVHTADSISGDFSIGVNGLWIEKGEVTYPVCGVTMGGNLMELLNSIEEVGDDLRFVGNIGSPSIHLSGMMIGGT